MLLASILRLYNVSSNPPGLYIDEVAIGHNAYQILTTGKDEHGVAYPLWFKSFGDYKMPVYIYSVAGAMAVFGKTEFAVRFPSVLSGILSVAVVFFLVKNLLALDKKFAVPFARYLPLLCAFFLAITPWHVHFSRGGFEVNLGVFFYLCALLLFVLFARHKHPVYLFSGILIFILSIYTYHSFRVTSPLTVVLSLSYFWFAYKKLRRQVLMALLLFLLLMLPIVLFSFTGEGSERFSQTSAFSEYPVVSAFDAIVTYPMVYVKNFASFFSLNYLFNFGDGIGRHQQAGFGLLYRWELPFFIIGLFALFRKKKALFFYTVLGILLLAIVPAALSRPSPHSLRPLLMVVPLTMIVSIGALSVFSFLKTRYATFILLCVVLVALFEGAYTTHFYLTHYPKVNLLDWGGAYKEVVIASQAVRNEYPLIAVDSKLSDIRWYYAFYSPDTEYVIVDSSWQKPQAYENEKVLYIRPFYGEKERAEIRQNILLPNLNNDIFAQFWEV